MGPILLIILRLFPGFSVGGEFVDSVTYLVEAAPPGRRGFAGSTANLGSTGGMLLGSAAAATVTSLAGPATLAAWAWRIPFLLGGVIASAAYLLRRHLPESPVESRANVSQKREATLRRAIREQPRTVLTSLLFTSGYGIVNYLTDGAATNVRSGICAHRGTAGLAHQRNRASSGALDRTAFRLAIGSSLDPENDACRGIFHRSDGFLESLPARAEQRCSRLWVAQLLFAFLLALVMGTAPAMLSEQFAPGHRVSAHAVTLNIGIGIFGGTAPMVAMALIRVTSNLMAPAAYLIIAASISALSVLALQERSREPLH